MTTTAPRKVFINLPIKNLDRSVAFFETLGFTFNQQFTDETTSMMNINEDAYAMLISEPRFQTFTPKAIADASTTSEVLIAISAESRGEVVEFVNRAFAAGATPAREQEDHGFMLGWSFQDLDHHIWEVVWMDPSFIQEG